MTNDRRSADALLMATCARPDGASCFEPRVAEEHFVRPVIGRGDPAAASWSGMRQRLDV